MTNNKKLWIRHKNNKYVVQKIDGNSAVQVAKFNTRKQAETYVDKYKVAAAMEKVVDKEYDFKELFLKFATAKSNGNRVCGRPFFYNFHILSKLSWPKFYPHGNRLEN